MSTPSRAAWAGAALLAAIIIGGAGGAARFVPTDHMLGPLARILESGTPVFLALGIILALCAALLGLRALGLALVGVLGLATLELGVSLARQSLPHMPEAQAHLRVVFFNARAENTANAARLVAAAMAQDPDVIIFTEAQAVLPEIETLRAAYPFVSPCAPEACELLVASTLPPRRYWTLTLNPVWEDRYGVLDLTPETLDRPVILAISHLAKPWFTGIAEPELALTQAQYNWLPEQAVVIGDFNMPPWSRPFQRLLAQTGFQSLRWPPGTWPAQAGALGLPIDQVLVRGGARVVAAQAFGAELGSNHRALRVDLAF